MGSVEAQKKLNRPWIPTQALKYIFGTHSSTAYFLDGPSLLYHEGLKNIKKVILALWKASQVLFELRFQKPLV